MRKIQETFEGFVGSSMGINMCGLFVEKKSNEEYIRVMYHTRIYSGRYYNNISRELNYKIVNGEWIPDSVGIQTENSNYYLEAKFNAQINDKSVYDFDGEFEKAEEFVIDEVRKMLDEMKKIKV